MSFNQGPFSSQNSSSTGKIGDVPSAESTSVATSASSSVFTVEQLNQRIKNLIEGSLSLVWVQGEISNFKAHTSGHFYLSLKDARSQISAVMFKGHNSRLKFKPYDGLEVIIRGRVTVYEPRGNYQIMLESMEPVGAGALQKAYEQLKEKLKKEGLFEASRKRPLPKIPRHVAIVTSTTGAAIQDMINVLTRRNKLVKVTLVPTIVQGDAAPAQIIEAMKKAYMLPGVDVVIVGRGGGSIEDLWAFNDEALARVITQSPVPVISAVGHEIDFTIADFVADVRAPTPSAAAEIVSQAMSEMQMQVGVLHRRLTLADQKIRQLLTTRVAHLSQRLVDPKRKLQDLMLRSDELSTRLLQAVHFNIEKKMWSLQNKVASLKSPKIVILEKMQKLETLQLRIHSSFQRRMESHQQKWKQLVSLLESLSPLKVVERGYSVVKKERELIKSTSQLKVNDLVNVMLMDGQFEAKVTHLNPTEKK